MQTYATCPGQSEWLAFNRGELDGEALEGLCQHLSSCTSCESAVAALEQADDGIVASLRKFLNRGVFVQPEQFHGMEARAKAIALEQRGRPASSWPPPDKLPIQAPAPAPGKRLGDYQLLREIGRGSMGIVFAAVRAGSNTQMAVKVILLDYGDQPGMRAGFRREMLATRNLVPRNIVVATDADEADGHLVLATELIDGLDLDALLKWSDPLPITDACEIVRQGALGLQYVFEHHRAHGDLKPSNMMLSTEGVVKILDLGLARLFSENGHFGEWSSSPTEMGTADYMAPEHWEDHRRVDIRADIYSLGCSLYKLLVGEAFFGGPECKPLAKKKIAYIYLPFPSIRSRRADVPARLAGVLERMLAKDPDQRFATPLQVADALRPFAKDCDCRQLIAAALQRKADLSNGPQSADGIETAIQEAKAKTPFASHGGKRGGLLRNALRTRWRLAAVVAAAIALLAGAVLYSLS